MGKQWKQWQTYFPEPQYHCRWWLQPWNQKTLASWKKSYDQPRQHIKKQRRYFTNKAPSSQSYGFPVVMYRCKSWTIKKAEHQRTDAFELWCWIRLLRVPWTARRSNQSILKEISPEHLLERLLLKLQYCGHLIWRTDSLEKTLMLGKIEDGRRRGQQRMRFLECITDTMDMSFSILWDGDAQGSLGCFSPWGHKESDTTEQLNWTEKCNAFLFVNFVSCNFTEFISKL